MNILLYTILFLIIGNSLLVLAIITWGYNILKGVKRIELIAHDEPLTTQDYLMEEDPVLRSDEIIAEEEKKRLLQ